MKIFIGFLSLLVSCAYCSHIPTIGLVAQHADITKLAKFLLAQPGMTALDPAASTKCFAIYLPQLQDVANQWSMDYNACIDVANGNRTELMDQMKQEQKAMSSEADVVCNFILNCQAIDISLNFFNCFANLGENTFSPVYSISTNASDFADTINQKMTTIDNEMYKCTNASERVYVEQTAKVYDALDYCLLNGPPSTEAPGPATTDAPGTSAPATDAPTTDTPATNAPATDAPATDAPATDAPATDAPATDAPATDAPATDAPATDAPATDAPATDAPATDAPATDAPATDAPATDAPATNAPAIDALEKRF